MLIHSLKLQQFLSFGPLAGPVAMKPLNVLIGSNGSGKSNVLEAIALLQNAPDQIQKPILEGGGAVSDWLYKGEGPQERATIEALLVYDERCQPLRYCLSFSAENQRFRIVDERLERERPDNESYKNVYFYYHFNNGNPTLNIKGKKRYLQHEDVNTESSILSQRRDPDQYPEITYLAQTLAKVRLYREWSFGRSTPPRVPQKANLPNEYLEADASNLGLVLNRLSREPKVKQRLLQALRALYEGIDDYHVQIEGGTVQVFFHEGNKTIPATRLSDGTLRYLCLLAILCHPNPPPVVCIEEPELGLHPDVLPTLAELLKEASTRCQLFVTTHSDVLVDAMHDCPEAVLVVEKTSQGTQLTRLDAEQLKPWLEKYRLGQLWTRGDIGGNRW